MKKSIYLFVVLVSLILITSCGSSTEGEGVRASDTSQAISGSVSLNQDLQAKVGSWVNKDVECYGIIVGYFADGTTLGKSVKCRVAAIKSDKIKMKTIESVSLLPGEGCDKMGLAYGDTWWEEDGDIFRTREEAEAFIESKGWTKK
ncbi:MAG TPA: hypothetical protein DIS74_03945 [Bacteroidales bacterium]|nr:hypothetical protein [Bacteroidales bacterium]